MNRIPDNVKNFINENAPQFAKAKPRIERVSTGVAAYNKALNTRHAGISKRVFSYTYILTKPFRQVLRITADSSGRIIKTSISR